MGTAQVQSSVSFCHYETFYPLKRGLPGSWVLVTSIASRLIVFYMLVL